MTDIQRLELYARKVVNRFVQKCNNPDLSPVCLAIEYWDMHDYLKWEIGFVPSQFNAEDRLPERVRNEIHRIWREEREDCEV